MTSLLEPNGPEGDSDARDNSTVSLLRNIESGVVDPKSIPVIGRRQLVGFLMADGYSTAEVGQILQVADRTIERDKKAIREANAIQRDPKLVEQMVGRLVGEAELSIQRIRKAVRDKGVASATKVDAEHRCYQIVSDLVRTMQRLGYLPTAAQRIEADLTHHVGEVPDSLTLRTEVRRLKEICQRSGDESPEISRTLYLLEGQIERADLASQIDEVSSVIIENGVTNDDVE